MLYLERDEEARQRFLEELEKIPPENRIYMDESGVDETLQRQYGRALRGEEVSGEISGKKANRISIIAALNQKQLIAPFRFEGYCDQDVVNIWAEECLLPCLHAGQVLICDNASFHKASRLKEILGKVGVTVLPLPTYSPDLNPIENHWAVAKARVRKYRKPNQPLAEILDKVLCMT